ncbi:unnamed protein product [Amoebophrya sp. A25]|nr:unnamed protein product [Amoebophrya sp. A25]|eukprot:GSA25T00025900001.1
MERPEKRKTARGDYANVPDLRSTPREIALEEVRKILDKDPMRCSVDELIQQMRLRLNLSDGDLAAHEEELLRTADEEIRLARERLRNGNVTGVYDDEEQLLTSLGPLRGEVKEMRELEEQRQRLRDAMRAVISAQETLLMRKYGNSDLLFDDDASSTAGSCASARGTARSDFSGTRGTSVMFGTSTRDIPADAVSPLRSRRKFGPRDLAKRKKGLRKKLARLVEGGGSLSVLPQPIPGTKSMGAARKGRMAKTAKLYSELFGQQCFWFGNAFASSKEAASSKSGAANKEGFFGSAAPPAFTNYTPVKNYVNTAPEGLDRTSFETPAEERDVLARKYLMAIEPLSRGREVVYLPFTDALALRKGKVYKMAVFADTTVGDLKQGLHYVYRDKFLGRHFDLLRENTAWSNDASTVLEQYKVEVDGAALAGNKTSTELQTSEQPQEGVREHPANTAIGLAAPIEIFFLDLRTPFSITCHLPIPVMMDHGHPPPDKSLGTSPSPIRAAATTTMTTTTRLTSDPTARSPQPSFVPVPTVSVPDQIARVASRSPKKREKVATTSASSSTAAGAGLLDSFATTSSHKHARKITVSHDMTVGQLRGLLQTTCDAYGRAGSRVAGKAPVSMELLMFESHCLTDDAVTLRTLRFTPKTSVVLLRILEKEDCSKVGRFVEDVRPKMREKVELLRSSAQQIGGTNLVGSQLHGGNGATSMLDHQLPSSLSTTTIGSSCELPAAFRLHVHSTLFRFSGGSGGARDTSTQTVQISPFATVYEALLLFEDTARTKAEHLVLHIRRAGSSSITDPLDPAAYLGDVLIDGDSALNGVSGDVVEADVHLALRFAGH